MKQMYPEGFCQGLHQQQPGPGKRRPRARTGEFVAVKVFISTPGEDLI